jgi:ankyrin repeat protein
MLEQQLQRKHKWDQRLVRRVQFDPCCALCSPKSSSMAPRRSSGRQSNPQQQQQAPQSAAEVRRLQAAAINGESASAVAAYLSAGGSPTAVVEVQNGGDFIKGPLIAAMVQRNRHPHTELAQSVGLLVSAGADVNATCSETAGYGRTALMWASAHDCCSDGVKLLLQHGADPCKLNFDGVSALHMAAAAGALEQCQLLIDAISARTVNLVDRNGMTPAAYATTAAKSLAVIELLHRHGADLKVRICAPHNITLLQSAADCNEVGIVQYLLRNGAGECSHKLQSNSSLQRSSERQFSSCKTATRARRRPYNC